MIPGPIYGCKTESREWRDQKTPARNRQWPVSFSGMINRMVLVVGALVDDALDYKTGTAELPLGILPDTDYLGGEVAGPELVGQFCLIEHLIEPDRDDIGPEFLNWAEHVRFVPEDCPVHGFQGCYHPEPELLRDDRAGLVLHVDIPGNDHHEFISQFPGLFEIEEVSGMEDVERACGNNAPDSYGITSMVQDLPSAVKQRQSFFRYGNPMIRW
jgi:hypothetical protein